MSITPQEIKKEFFKSKMGIAGITILGILILTSIVTMITIPVETFQEWNNPENWITYPKTAIPIWVNFAGQDSRSVQDEWGNDSYCRC